MEFLEPGEDFSGLRINPRDVLNHLLLIWVVEYLPHKPTQFSRPDKPSDVIVVDVVDLDDQDPDTGQPGLLARHVWWRQARLIQKLKGQVGNPNPLLARIGKGSAAQGYNAPFVLNSASKDAAAQQQAMEWFARNPGFTPSVPFEPSGTDLPVQGEPRQETLVERMARQSLEGAARLPRPPAPPNQGPIPF